MKQVTRTAIVLDRSGSMQSMREEAIGAFNDQLKVIQDEEEEGSRNFVSLITFATFVDTPHFENAPAAQIPALTEDRYTPSGGTAMLDAVGQAVDLLEASSDAEDENTSFLVVVVSDGQENSSREWNWKTTAERLQKLQETERWTFVYLGANQDLTEVSKNMHIPVSNTMSFTGPQGLTGASGPTGSHSTGLKTYFEGRKMGKRSSKSFYNPDSVDIK